MSISAKFLAAALAAVLVSASLAFAATIPQLGDGEDLTVTEEREFGDKIARQLFASPEVMADAVLQEYVVNMLERLRTAARSTGDLPADLDEHMAWNISLMRNNVINAFALPGGYFGVNLGLIAKMRQSDELAAVLAHELSHVTQRHISRMMTQREAQAPWMTGALIWGVLAASKNPNATNAVIASGHAISRHGQLSFSRDMEREADRVGYGVLTAAGYTATGFVSLFETLQATNRLNAQAPSPYLVSHPLTTERIADMQTRYALNPPTGRVVNMDDDAVTALIAARASALASHGRDALRVLMDKGTGLSVFHSAPRLGALYAAALSAIQLNEVDFANERVAELKASALPGPGSRRLVRLLELELALRTETPALPELVDASDVSRAQLLLAGEIHVKTGTASQAVELLKAGILRYPADPQMWQALSVAQSVSGARLDAIRSQAEAYALQLEFQKAVDVLHSWREQAAGDSGAHLTEQLAVDARLKEFSSRR